MKVITRLTELSRSYKISVYIVLIFGVLMYTFLHSMQRNMHRTVPEAIGRHEQAIGMAISELRFGSTGYSGYFAVLNKLTEHGMTNDPRILENYGMTADELLTNGDILNNAIEVALHTKDVSSFGQYQIFGDDIGLVTYYELSFYIFGYRIESFFYLYFLLFSGSIVVFLLTFYRRVDLLNVLLLLTCSHFVISSVAPIVGIELQTVHNPRFLPVLAIIPALYISLLILGKEQLNLMTLSGTIIQTCILVLVIHARSSARYEIIFLSVIFSLLFLWHYWRHNLYIGKYLLNRTCFWPLGIVIIGLFILNFHLLLYRHYSYSATTTAGKHVFWHAVYIGLSAHPDSWRKYDIDFQDMASARLVQKRAYELYGVTEPVPYYGELYEPILKSETIRILINDPRFAIETFLYYKPLMFFKSYFSPSFGATRYLFSWPLLPVLVLGSLLAGRGFLRQWLRYFALLVFALLFSLIPSMLAVPHPAYIADPALLFTCIIYMVISGLLAMIYSGQSSVFSDKLRIGTTTIRGQDLSRCSTAIFGSSIID